MVNSVDEVLKVLKDKDVINSPDYWLKAVDVVKCLGAFIINVTNKVD